MLRCIASFTINDFTKWTGLILNIILFSFSNIFIYKISKKIFKNPIYGILACFINGFSLISINTSNYIRMYELANLATLSLTWFHLKIYEEEKYCKLENKIEKDSLKIDGLEINDRTKEVFVDGENVKLTPIEYKLLYFLAINKGQVFSIKQIYENVWKEPFDGYEKKVVVHISHIREKIEINPREPRYLKAVWGLDYKIENF